MTWTLSAFADEAGPSKEQQIDALRRAGLTCIDLRNVEGHNISALPIELARTVKSKLDEAEITVGMFGSPIGKIDIADDFDIDVQRLEHLGAMARIFECNAVRIFSYYNGQDQPFERWHAKAIDRLRQLRDRAAKLGLVLYHENEAEIFGDHCDQVVLIADELCDGEVFRLIFDFDNFDRSGDDVWACWQRLRDRVDAIHLKDSTREGQHVPVGRGAGKVRQILADARSIGWEGLLTLEPHLKYSEAVLATGPSGQPNQVLKHLSEVECFHVAAVAAKELIDQVGAVVV